MQVCRRELSRTYFALILLTLLVFSAVSSIGFFSKSLKSVASSTPQPCSYQVFTNNTFYYGENCMTGSVVYGGPNNSGNVSGTNFAAIVNAMISSYFPNPVSIDILPGNFSVASQILDHEQLSLIGAGESQTRLYEPVGLGKTMILLDSVNGGYSLNGTEPDRSIISNFAIDGGWGDGGEGQTRNDTCLNVQSPTWEVTLSNLDVYHCGGFGIQTSLGAFGALDNGTGNTETTYSNLEVDHNQLSGIVITNSADSTGIDLYSGHNGQFGFYMRQGGGNSWTHLVGDSNNNSGFYIQNLNDRFYTTGAYENVQAGIYVIGNYSSDSQYRADPLDDFFYGTLVYGTGDTLPCPYNDCAVNTIGINVENSTDVSFIGGSSQALYPAAGHPLAEYGMHFAGDSNIYVSDMTVVNNWDNPKIQVNGINNNISISDCDGYNYGSGAIASIYPAPLGPSPYSFPFLTYPAVYVIESGANQSIEIVDSNGMVSNVSSHVGIPILVEPWQTLRIFYSDSPPLIAIIPSSTIAPTTLLLSPDESSYLASPGTRITISGTVLPAPGVSGTNATVSVTNPDGIQLTQSIDPVDPNTGSFSNVIITGSGATWINGTYTIEATWLGSVNGTPISVRIIFEYGIIRAVTSSTSTTVVTSQINTTLTQSVTVTNTTETTLTNTSTATSTVTSTAQTTQTQTSTAQVTQTALLSTTQIIQSFTTSQVLATSTSVVQSTLVNTAFTTLTSTSTQTSTNDGYIAMGIAVAIAAFAVTVLVLRRKSK